MLINDLLDNLKPKAVTADLSAFVFIDEGDLSYLAKASVIRTQRFICGLVNGVVESSASHPYSNIFANGVQPQSPTASNREPLTKSQWLKARNGY